MAATFIVNLIQCMTKQKPDSAALESLEGLSLDSIKTTFIAQEHINRLKRTIFKTKQVSMPSSNLSHLPSLLSYFVCHSLSPHSSATPLFVPSFRHVITSSALALYSSPSNLSAATTVAFCLHHCQG